MCMFFYLTIHFQRQPTFLFLKKPYLLCTTLILMDSSNINEALHNTKTMKVKINAQTCLFEQTSFASIPPFIPKSKHLNINKFTT